MKRWFYFLFLLVLILSARSAVLAETSTVSINNVFFSNLEHPDGKAIYHTGQNNVTAELRHFGTDEIPVLLAFTVEDTGTGKLLSVGAKQITAKGNYPITCTVSCTVPNDTAIANTHAKLLALHARTLQPLDDLISIAPDASYPFADTTAKTQLVSSFSGTIVSAENGVIVLSPNESIRSTETIDIPAPAALVEDAQTRIGAACNVLADILPTGEKKRRVWPVKHWPCKRVISSIFHSNRCNTATRPPAKQKRLYLTKPLKFTMTEPWLWKQIFMIGYITSTKCRMPIWNFPHFLTGRMQMDFPSMTFSISAARSRPSSLR